MEYRNIICSEENIERIQTMIQKIMYKETSLNIEKQRNIQQFILTMIEARPSCVNWGHSDMVESFNYHFVKIVVPHMISELNLRLRDIEWMSKKNVDIKNQDPRNFLLNKKQHKKNIDDYHFPVMEISDNVKGLSTKAFSFY